MDGEDSAVAEGALQMTWNPLAEYGDCGLPSGAMDFSHDWAPIVTPARRRSMEAGARSGTAVQQQQRPPSSSSSAASEAERVEALGHALQRGLGFAGQAGQEEGGPGSPLSWSYSEVPVALAEQVRLFMPMHLKSQSLNTPRHANTQCTVFVEGIASFCTCTAPK
jgi:hypothetical protein